MISLCIGLLLASGAKAMDMSSSSGSSSSESMAMMLPYLHFTGGDYLFFDTVAPTSRGAIAGACIALAVLAILERAVAGARGIFALHVLHRQRALLWQRQSPRLVASETETPRVETKLGIEEASAATSSSRASPAFTIQPLSAQRPRSMAPFLWSYELARGAMFVIQSFFVYTIMLAVMSFNAAYIISIIAGTAIGEVLFGRFIAEHTH